MTWQCRNLSRSLKPLQWNNEAHGFTPMIAIARCLMATTGITVHGIGLHKILLGLLLFATPNPPPPRQEHFLGFVCMCPTQC